MKWKDKLINEISIILEHDEQWSVIINRILKKNNGSIHLAVFNEPFLTMIFTGSKTIESRFSINKVAPFGKIKNGDIVIVKKSGGAILAVFEAGNVKYFSNLKPQKLVELEIQFGQQIGWYKDEEFIKNKALSKYLTLVDIKNLRRVTPIETTKQDRTAWVLLKTTLKDTLFENY